jgi:hypothetical protein
LIGTGCCPPGPSDCIVGYAGEITVADNGPGKCKFKHTGYQEPTLFHPCCWCCCCQLCLWGKIGATILNGDITKIEKSFKPGSMQPPVSVQMKERA